MKKFITLMLIVWAYSVNGQPGFYCKDSTLINEYFQCGVYAGGDVFDPVCGCDNITYRNQCAAEHWGGLAYGAWTSNAVCGNFAFDFRPTALSYIATGNYPARIQLFIRNPSQASVPIAVYVYDDFGKLWYTWSASSNVDGKFPLEPKELPLQSLKMGIYIMIVVVNNEKQTIKFGKLTNE